MFEKRDEHDTVNHKGLQNTKFGKDKVALHPLYNIWRKIHNIVAFEQWTTIFKSPLKFIQIPIFTGKDKSIAVPWTTVFWCPLKHMQMAIRCC